MEDDEERVDWVLELREEGLTPSEIAKETGYPIAWINEIIVRAELDDLEREARDED
jgi:transcriptional regulator